MKIIRCFLHHKLSKNSKISIKQKLNITYQNINTCKLKKLEKRNHNFSSGILFLRLIISEHNGKTYCLRDKFLFLR